MTSSIKELPRQLCRNPDGTIHSGFVITQRIYADHGISTFPVKIDEANEKKPLVCNWMKVRPQRSAEWAQKFPLAPAAGMLLGPRTNDRISRRGEKLPPASGVSEGDINSRDERVLADFLSRYGQTKIIIRSGSGKFKTWYAHNGERRSIRPWPELPIDILGDNGYTIVPPSFNPCANYQQYEFIQGCLDDIGRLPIMQNLDPALYRTATAPPRKRTNKSDGLASSLSGMREGDGRNQALFKAIGTYARENFHNTRDQLFEVAMNYNQACADPLPAEEVNHLVGNVWSYTVDGINTIGRRSAIIPADDIEALISSDQDLLLLLNFFRACQGPSAKFMITNSLHKTFHWREERFVAARNRMIERGYIRQVKKAWSRSPALFEWCGYMGTPK